MDYFFGVNDPNLTYITILCAIGFLLLTIFAGFAYDTQRPADLHQTPSAVKN